jgi:hypothetical protein
MICIQNFLNSSIFWDKTPSGPSKVNQRLGGIYLLFLHRQRIIQVRNKHEAGTKQSLLFDPEGGGKNFLRNLGEPLTGYTALYPRRYNSS